MPGPKIAILANETHAIAPNLDFQLHSLAPAVVMTHGGLRYRAHCEKFRRHHPVAGNRVS